MSRIDQWREDRERDIRRDADRFLGETVAAWAVRQGPVEIRRQVDDDALIEALDLLGGIDKRRYVRHPEIRKALADAQAALHAAARLNVQRSWAAFEADRTAGR